MSGIVHIDDRHVSGNPLPLSVNVRYHMINSVSSYFNEIIDIIKRN
jgi:hypothetical protein